MVRGDGTILAVAGLRKVFAGIEAPVIWDRVDSGPERGVTPAWEKAPKNKKDAKKQQKNAGDGEATGALLSPACLPSASLFQLPRHTNAI